MENQTESPQVSQQIETPIIRQSQPNLFLIIAGGVLLLVAGVTGGYFIGRRSVSMNVVQPKTVASPTPIASASPTPQKYVIQILAFPLI